MMMMSYQVININISTKIKKKERKGEREGGGGRLRLLLFVLFKKSREVKKRRGKEANVSLLSKTYWL